MIRTHKERWLLHDGLWNPHHPTEPAQHPLEHGPECPNSATATKVYFYDEKQVATIPSYDNHSKQWYSTGVSMMAAFIINAKPWVLLAKLWVWGLRSAILDKQGEFSTVQKEKVWTEFRRQNMPLIRWAKKGNHHTNGQMPKGHCSFWLRMLYRFPLLSENRTKHIELQHN